MHLRLPVVAMLALGLVLPIAHAAQPWGDIPHSQWNAPQKPFRIYGNTWYVGPHGLTSLLVDTGHGLALFDGDLPESAPVIEAHIRELGFHVRDVKWILNSHPHADHAGGIAALQAASGAQVLTSTAGARELALGGADRSDPQFGAMPYYPPVQRVRVVRDGETVQLGDAAITAHYTPGHTAGSTSWTWTSCAGQRCLRIAYADSLSAISAPDYRFTDHPAYIAGFRQALATVAALPCDILLTPHPDASGFWEKIARRKSPADVTPLVDTQACRDYAAEAGNNLDARLAKEQSKAR
ncbi:subclass B3 metallo-beta-lactamase [Rhodanobacter sp. 7MK24]|uniref:subclass B3 metallo-beta-lactamase n=1 Tax=Rhodanobacter sp. 7MK24 TaxID=2775922 RepID=UPI00177D0342|nr:subclass B3 metallo-beta-lactamase [Rhodanobacter sp. 7MK24]MBD8882045.1 subclass B3 metallo-beta-lactamase [Rhodanobacter sp. 7MK24]